MTWPTLTVDGPFVTAWGKAETAIRKSAGNLTLLYSTDHPDSPPAPRADSVRPFRDPSVFQLLSPQLNESLSEAIVVTAPKVAEVVVLEAFPTTLLVSACV